MSRTFMAYDLATTSAGSGHQAATSSGTGNKQTITKPARANAMLLSAVTTSARCTFDGTDPGAGVAPGLVIVAGAQPVFLPFASDIEFVSNAAGNSELNVLYLD